MVRWVKTLGRTPLLAFITRTYLIMEYNIEKAVAAQKEHLKELAKKNPKDWMAESFARGIGFAPVSGVCYRCHKNIYSEDGISVEQASKELVTGCPFCHRSYVD